MSQFETLASHKVFGGRLSYLSHESAANHCTMRLTCFTPPKATGAGLIYLSGLTCTEENFTIKAGAYREAAALGLTIIAPDTSPRGENVAAGDGNIGFGAGFYLNATEEPWREHYQMESYITEELIALVASECAVDLKRLGVMGHSMGGHGALTLSLRHPDLFHSLSVLAPVCTPSQTPWGQTTLAAYLGNDPKAWEAHDASKLMTARGKPLFASEVLIDQGESDSFWVNGRLNPEAYVAACAIAGQKVNFRLHDGYDHGYFFIQTFIDDHLRHHAALLG